MAFKRVSGNFNYFPHVEVRQPRIIPLGKIGRKSCFDAYPTRLGRLLFSMGQRFEPVALKSGWFTKGS
ncbi:MAG: hypothetical protein ACLU4J_20100 [Butyricimonas paravirosa]